MLAAAVMVAVAGCTGGLPGTQGDPGAPVLVRGRVVDAVGAPVAGAVIEVYVRDYENSEIGVAVPTVYHESFTANLDGSFEIHLGLVPRLRDFTTERQEAFVNFSVIAMISGGVGVWNFPREIENGTWAGEAPDIELRPIGSR
jgi:hypothetical protein